MTPGERQELLKHIENMRVAMKNSKPYDHVKAEEIGEAIEHVKALKIFAVKNQDYYLAATLRDIEKILATLK